MPILSRSLTGLAACSLLLGGTASYGTDKDPVKRPAEHHTSDGFRNRFSDEHHGVSWAFLRFLWELQTADWEKPDMPMQAPDLDFLHGNGEEPTATWLGHAGFLLQLGGYNVLTDPVLTERVSPVDFAGPARLFPPPLEVNELPPIDAVVVSHNHYDHLDLPTLEALRDAHDPLIVVPLRLEAWLRDRGFERVVELDWWQAHALGELRIHAVPVQHFSGRGLFDRNRTLWAGYVVEGGGKRVFFAGDTGYSRDFAEIGERFGPIDLALIPIGAYEPRDFMRPVHVNPEEAVKIHRDVGADRSIGMHWGTFRLTTEPLDEPPKRLREAVRDAGLAPEAFDTVALGETVRLNENGEPGNGR